MSVLHSFGVNAEQRLKRTRFKHHDTRDLTFAPGWLVPIYVRDVIPSDVWNAKQIDVQVKQVLESLKPTFGDVYLSMYYFFVPYRLLWKKWPEIFGKGTPSEWDTPVEVVAPTCKYAAGYNSSSISYKSNTGNGYDAVVNTCCIAGATTPSYIASARYNLADYLGFATTVLNVSTTTFDINWLWFAAYEKIWTDFFRNENVQEPDPDVEKCFNYSGSGALDVRFALHYANKLKDVYTTILPSPQKGAPVTVNIGSVAPVNIAWESGGVIPANDATVVHPYADVGNGEGLVLSSPALALHPDTVTGNGRFVADLSNAVGATVNEVRFDFAMQRMKERDARGGTRYNEVLLSTFEAYNGDITLSRPELLGGDTIQLNMTTVPSTGSNPGKLGGMSNTNASTRPFVKTFGEFGVLMGVACIRPRNMYAQGMPKAALKTRRYHWYDPALQNVGDQPVDKALVYAVAGAGSVLGFQEAWFEYRSDENIVCGDMRGGTTDMDAWSYVQKFTSEPYLNSAFMVQDGSAITKTLVGYNGTDYPGYVYAMHLDFHMEVTSPMMPHSIPGLIDHIM